MWGLGAAAKSCTLLLKAGAELVSRACLHAISLSYSSLSARCQGRMQALHVWMSELCRGPAHL